MISIILIAVVERKDRKRLLWFRRRQPRLDVVECNDLDPKERTSPITLSRKGGVTFRIPFGSKSRG